MARTPGIVVADSRLEDQRGDDLVMISIVDAASFDGDQQTLETTMINWQMSPDGSPYCAFHSITDPKIARAAGKTLLVGCC